MALIIIKLEQSSEMYQTLLAIEASLPSPLKHIHLFRGTVSWGERILMALQLRFPRELFCFTGKNLLSVADCRDFIRRVNKAAANALQINDGETLEDTTVQEMMQLTLQTMVDKRVQYLQPYGVNSEVELREKQRRLVEIKDQAVRHYFDRYKGRNFRLAIDLALVGRCTGELSQKNSRILDQYWNFNREHPWGPEHHVRIEQEIYEHFKKAIVLVLEYIEPRKNSFFNMNFGAHLKKALVNEIRQVRLRLLERVSNTKDAKQLIILNYQLLKIELFTTLFIRYVLRKVLGPLIEKTSREVKKLAEQKHREAQKEIEKCEEDLRSFNCCIDPEKIQNHLGATSTPEMVASILSVNQRDRELTTNILARLRVKTLDTFLFEAMSEKGHSVKEMQTILDEEVEDHERAIRACMLVWDLRENLLKSAALHSHDPDLRLNLELMEDPIKYFVQGYQQRDAEALALLQIKAKESTI